MIPVSGLRRRPAGWAACLAAGSASAIMIAAAAAEEVPVPRAKPVPTVTVTASTGQPDEIADYLESQEDATGDTEPAKPAARASGPLPKPGSASPVAFLTRAEYDTFKRSFDAALEDNFPRALDTIGSLSDPTAKTLIEWLYMRSPQGAYVVDEVAGFLRRHPDWPDPEALRTRAEGILHARPPGARKTIAYFSEFAPLTGVGVAALANAHLELGEKDKATALVVAAWRTEELSSALERDLAERCECITKALDKERLDRMAYSRSSEPMLRAAKRLGAAYVELAEAHIAVAKRSRGADKQYKQVPESLRGDTALSLSRATWLRRADKDEDARKIVLAAPRNLESVLDAEAWWTERRLLARRGLGQKELAREAYELAAGHALEKGQSYADAEFLSGWIALRHLHDPALALKHFQNLRGAVDQPISVARAEYWIARARDTLGQTGGAQEHRLAASRHGVTFYGQLARNEIHGAQSRLVLPSISEEVYLAATTIEEVPLMRAARLLAAAGERWLASKFLYRLAYRTDEPGALHRIANFANLMALPQVGVRVGKIGIYDGMPVHDVAYPVSDFPRLSPEPDIEPALLLALTRQESEFAWQASSRVGARGLMQIMPATGKMLARQAGVGYSLTRLGEDPHYNASLGSRFLVDLVDQFSGSYVLAIASYNAGPGRVGEWIERYGDPRSSEIDVIDWIESIPFDETRNYVQRVLENLQVYRARLAGSPVPLKLAEDLARGRAGGQRAHALD